MLRRAGLRLGGASKKWTGQVIADICIVPMGQGTSVRKEVAAVEGLFRKYQEAGKLTCHLHGYGTNVEGQWDDVMSAVKEAHELLHDDLGVARITASWRLGTRVDKSQSIADKVNAVEDILGKEANGQTEELAKEVKGLKGNLRTCIKAMNDGVSEFRQGEPDFAFLVLQEHPYGREMLKQLLAQGFKPKIVIEENDGKIAAEERGKFEKRIEGNPLALEIAEQCAANSIERVTVPHHNLAACVAHLQRVKPRLVVLGGTRIIRDPVLSFPVDGVINAHPGLLPECRGSASPAWSVYHDIQIGSTCHICEPGIDEGDVLIKREIPVKRGYTYSDLCYKTLCLSGTLMTEAVSHYAKHGNFNALRMKQADSPNPTFVNASDEVLTEVYKKLKEQTYKHYVE